MLRRQALAEGDRLVQSSRHHDAAVARERDRRRAGLLAAAARSRARQRWRAVFDGVIRIARASGSCSAWAIRSAAIHSARPVSERTAISLGPAKKSIAQSLATSAFAAATYALPGPTILSTFGTVAVPYASARNRVGSADPEQPIDTCFPRSAQDCRVRPGAHGDDLAHACYARGNRRHQERRRERIAPAGDVAADAIERHDALLDSHAGRRGDRPAPRDLPACDAADVSSRQSNRVTHVAWSRADAGIDLCRLDLERRGQPVEAPRECQKRGLPLPSHTRDDARNACLERRSRAGRRSRRPLTARSSVLSMMRIIGTYAVGDRGPGSN